MNKFLRAYFLYTDQLKQFALNEPLFFVKNGVLPLNNLEKYGLYSDDEKLLKAYLKQRLNLFDGSDDGEGGREMTLIELIDMAYPVKAKFLRQLERLILTEETDIKEKLQSLLNATTQAVAALEKTYGKALTPQATRAGDFDEQGDLFEPAPIMDITGELSSPETAAETSAETPLDEAFGKTAVQKMAAPIPQFAPTILGSPVEVSSASKAAPAEATAVDPVISQSFTFPLLATAIKSIPTPVKKAYELRQFFYDHAKAEAYLPTTPARLDTSKFGSFTRADIAEMFAPENFYKLSKSDVMALLQAASNEYLLSNDVEPCAVVFEPLKISNRSVQFGEHNPNRGVTIINSKLLDKFDEMKDSGNVSFPYQLLATVIHEGRHRIQFSNLNNNSGTSEASRLISRALLVPQNTMTKGEYLASPDEIDARNAAMEYISEVAKETDNENLKAFYNQQKAYEQTNGKNEVSSSLKQQFKHIYSSAQFQTSKKLARDRAKMFDTIFQTSSAAQPAS